MRPHGCYDACHANHGSCLFQFVRAPKTNAECNRLHTSVGGLSGGAIDRTLAEGNEAILPPHVSNLLGISPKEHEIPVKQFVEMGEPIRGFEVSTAEHNNVVIFVESRTQKKSTFYLTSRRGILRKVLSIIEGVGYSRVPTKDDKDEFEKEKKRWTDQLATQHS